MWFGQQCLHPQGEVIFISLMGEKIHNNGLVSCYEMIILGMEPPFFSSSSSLSLFFLFPSLFAMCPPCFSLLFFLLFCFFSLHEPKWACSYRSEWAYEYIGTASIFFPLQKCIRLLLSSFSFIPIAPNFSLQ